MSAWTLTIAGLTQTLAAWHAEEVTLARKNLSADLLTFTVPRAGFDDDPLCDYGGTIILTAPDGSIWFIGERQLTPGDASGSSESQSYSFLGPWRWLEQNTFQQPWRGTYTTHVLFLGSVGSNIKSVLDYSIAQGANLQYVQAELDVLAAVPPSNEVTDKFCASCILDNLQFAPDVVTWFDYATTPPTLHLQPRGSLPAASLRLSSYSADETLPVCEAINVTSRPDLQIPSAKIVYETTETVDGVQYILGSVDVYPPAATGLEDGAFNAVVTLQGRNVTNVFGEIKCLAIDHSSLEWWKLHVRKLADTARVQTYGGPSDIHAYDVDGTELDLTTLYGRELIEGQIADWMELDDGTPVAWQKVRLAARFAYNELDGSGNLLKAEQDGEFAIDLVTTNAPDGVSNYSAVASIEEGDSPITGLASYLYNALSPLQYEARLMLIQEECDATVDLGTTVNLLGSRAEFASMAALVQEVTYLIDSGTTHITCGPPKHLSLSDVLALLTRFRVRRRWTNPDTQSTGELGSGNGDVTLGRGTPNNAAAPGSEAPKYLAVVYAGTATQKIALDAETQALTISGTRNVTLSGASGELSIGARPGTGDGNISLAVADAAGKSIRLRIVPVCDNGVNKRIIVLASEIF